MKNNLDAFRTLFIAATLIAAGWFIDDRFQAKLDPLVLEVREMRKDLKNLAVKVGHLEGRLKAGNLTAPPE